MRARDSVVRGLFGAHGQASVQIQFGLLLGLLMWINFGGVALWVGVATAAVAMITADIWRGCWAERGKPRLLGFVERHFLTATIFSARQFVDLFADDLAGHPADHRAKVAARRHRSDWQCSRQLGRLGTGQCLGLRIGRARAGLLLSKAKLRARHAVYAATALATLGMVYGSRFVHAVFAARYRDDASAGLLAVGSWRHSGLLVSAAMAANRLHRPTDRRRLARRGVNWNAADRLLGQEWDFFRTRGGFDQRAGARHEDAVFASPDVNYRCLARYYGLWESERLAETIICAGKAPTERTPPRLWMLVNVYTPPGQQDLQRVTQTGTAAIRTVTARTFFGAFY